MSSSHFNLFWNISKQHASDVHRTQCNYQNQHWIAIILWSDIIESILTVWMDSEFENAKSIMVLYTVVDCDINCQAPRTVSSSVSNALFWEGDTSISKSPTIGKWSDPQKQVLHTFQYISKYIFTTGIRFVKDESLHGCFWITLAFEKTVL